MQKLMLALMLFATGAIAADNPETLAERSQARARKVLDAAVAAIGGAIKEAIPCKPIRYIAEAAHRVSGRSVPPAEQ